MPESFRRCVAVPDCPDPMECDREGRCLGEIAREKHQEHVRQVEEEARKKIEAMSLIEKLTCPDCGGRIRWNGGWFCMDCYREHVDVFL